MEFNSILRKYFMQFCAKKLTLKRKTNQTTEQNNNGTTQTTEKKSLS